MTLQTCPSDRIIRRFSPVLLSEKDGKRIYDAGSNITGWVSPLVEGKAGERVEIRYGEMLDGRGNVDYTSCGEGQIQQDSYISGGAPLRCRPHFTWHGFRYFQVSGPATQLEVHQVHAAVDVSGAFSCSDDTLNWLMDAYRRTRLNNLHCGVPTDCPHRERLGYTGDGQATAMTDMYLLDGDLFYRKWIRDIWDCQDPATGHVQHTAPFYGGGGGPGGWGGAVVLVPWAHYCRYGDADILRQGWAHMEKWVSYMFSRMDERGAVAREEEKGWCLGDWCAPGPVLLPEAFVNTCYLARCLLVMKEIAPIIGQDGDGLGRRLSRVQRSIEKNWRQGIHYCQGLQGADALALEAGLGGAPLATAMAARYREKPWFDTGFLASGSLIRQLFRFGHGETAVALLTSRVPGHSFGWQRDQGADTLWERWDGTESRNHPMFGGVVEGLFSGLGGISLRTPSRLRPAFPRQLARLSCRVLTRLGPVGIAWRREKNEICLETELPAAGSLVLPDRALPLAPGTSQTEVPLSWLEPRP